MKQLVEEEQTALRMFYAEHAIEQCNISQEDMKPWMDYFWNLRE